MYNIWSIHPDYLNKYITQRLWKDIENLYKNPDGLEILIFKHDFNITGIFANPTLRLIDYAQNIYYKKINKQLLDNSIFNDYKFDKEGLLWNCFHSESPFWSKKNDRVAFLETTEQQLEYELEVLLDFLETHGNNKLAEQIKAFTEKNGKIIPNTCFKIVQKEGYFRFLKNKLIPRNNNVSLLLSPGWSGCNNHTPFPS